VPAAPDFPFPLRCHARPRASFVYRRGHYSKMEKERR
jgi:hypothetical protein